MAAPELARVLGDDPPVLANDDVIGVGLELDRPPDGARVHRIMVVVEAQSVACARAKLACEAQFRHRRRRAVEPVEAAAILDQLRPLLFEDLPDRAFALLGMGVRPGPGQTFVEKPGVEVVIALEPQSRRKKPLANEANLVLDLPLLPARGRGAGHRFDQVMRAHLEKAAIVLPVLTDEDRLHRRLHTTNAKHLSGVVVDAALADALEECESPIMGVEHHLLRLARIGAHEHHPAVAEANVGDLHRRRHAVQRDELMAPIKLIGLTRRKAQWNVRRRRRARMLLAPAQRMAPHCRVAAVKAEPLQFLEYPDQRQTFARRLLRVRLQQAIEPLSPWPETRHRPPTSLVAKLRRARANDFPHDLS